MTETPHEWFRPRLAALMAGAASAGIARDVSVAVITDLVNGPLAASEPPPSADNPNQDIGEPDYMANESSGSHPSLPVDDGSVGGIGQVGGTFGPHRHW
jgi:hypothetical protein